MTGVVKQAKRKQAGTLNRVSKEQNLVHMLPCEYWKHKKYDDSTAISSPKLRHRHPGHIGNQRITPDASTQNKLEKVKQPGYQKQIGYHQQVTESLMKTNR